uniref:HSR domain-containing protein n=1 Tax=Felis catus TaxID=9685 RepID=A0ABI7Y4Z8_FELCA
MPTEHKQHLPEFPESFLSSRHFIYQKLEIAYAIHKPFPFLEGLRDNSFITETMYRESMEAYRNQVPVPRLVYNILSHLEKMFNLSFLQMLFSRINLREYPDLTRILKSFRSDSVWQKDKEGQRGREMNRDG